MKCVYCLVCILYVVTIVPVLWFIYVNVHTRSKGLWSEGFPKLNSVHTGKELSDLQEFMWDKEINLRTDIYEILLQESWLLFSKIKISVIGVVLNVPLWFWYCETWCKFLWRMFVLQILFEFDAFIPVRLEVHVNYGGQPRIMYLNVLCKYVLKKQILGTLILLAFVVQWLLVLNVHFWYLKALYNLSPNS